MKRNLAAFLPGLIALILVFPPNSFCVDNGKHLQAEQYLRAGLYLEAIDAYQEIAEHSDQVQAKARAILMIGDIYGYYLDDYDSALQKYYLVKAKYGTSDSAPNAFFNSGMILYEKGRYRDALVQFRMYLKNDYGGQRKETAEYMVEACLRETPKTAEPPAEKRFLPFPVSGGMIRVLIRGSVKEAVISCIGPPELKDMTQEKRLKKLEAGPLAVRVSGGELTVNGEGVGADGFIVVPSASDRLTLNGKAYRGRICVKKTAEDRMDVVNILDVEEYLYSVVPKEMSSLWPLEALKAQAIVARTFALYQRDKNRNVHYDVCSTTLSQVYGGLDAETDPSRRAVDGTRGKVLIHKGKLILAYYHANSGGATEDAKNVWAADVPYLRGVRDPFSESAPDCRWTFSVRVADLSKSLAGYGTGVVRDVVPLEFSPSGRVVKVRVLREEGETVLRCNDFRLKLDPRLLRSTLFAMTREGDRVRFDGKGYGHGVGLSQWGAREMAKRGFSCQDILAHYYPKVEIGNYSVAAKPGK